MLNTTRMLPWHACSDFSDLLSPRISCAARILLPEFARFLVDSSVLSWFGLASISQEQLALMCTYIFTPLE